MTDILNDRTDDALITAIEANLFEMLPTLIGCLPNAVHESAPDAEYFMSDVAFPLFSGFVSKSMVLAAMIEEGYDTLWLVLLFASAGVLHHAGIKVPYHAFFGKDSGIRTQEAPLNMVIAMGIAAILCIFIGTQPSYLYALLPWEVEFWPYDTTHVLTQFQLLLFAVLAKVCGKAIQYQY